MANLFLQLPALAQNGAGTPIDVSALASFKTIVVAGSWRLTPNITIEVNNDPAQAGGWAPLDTLQGAGILNVGVVAMFMRVRVSNFKGGDAPEVWVGAVDDAGDFDTLVAPAGNGAGAAVDVSTVGPFKSVQVAGTYNGALIVEVSEDGGATWGTAFAFPSGQTGIQSGLFIADFMRVKRVGVPPIAPGLPIINVGAGNSPSGGGGGGGSGNRQTFRYVATGAEANPFTVPLPAARLDTQYNVSITMGGPAANSIKDARALVSSFTVNGFDIELGGAIEAGDIFMITVEDLT